MTTPAESAWVLREEGFARAADTWEAICVSERQHEKRYRELADSMEVHHNPQVAELFQRMAEYSDEHAAAALIAANASGESSSATVPQDSQMKRFFGLAMRSD